MTISYGSGPWSTSTWRCRAFALAGYTILPYTVRDLDRPATLVREVRAILQRLSEW